MDEGKNRNSKQKSKKNADNSSSNTSSSCMHSTDHMTSCTASSSSSSFNTTAFNIGPFTSPNFDCLTPDALDPLLSSALADAHAVSLLDSIQDPTSYILEAFDHIIAPHIPNPIQSSQTSVSLRRFLYRKHFGNEAVKLLAVTGPITNVEQLIPIITTACANCGLSLV